MYVYLCMYIYVKRIRICKSIYEYGILELETYLQKLICQVYMRAYESAYVYVCLYMYIHVNVYEYVKTYLCI
jgi:hypothetical protein